MKRSIAAEGETSEYVEQLNITHILPNHMQPRKRFDRERLQSLARSLESQGVIQPIVVRRHPHRRDRYELVAGERRLRAMRLLGWQVAPALVRDIPEKNLLESALVENIQREQLTPIEEAKAYHTLLGNFGYTQESLARRVGKDRSTIANLIRLLGLPERLQEDLQEFRLTIGHARAMLALQSIELQLALRDLILEKNLSVRETEARIKRMLENGNQRKNPPPAPPPADPKYNAVQDAMESRLHTRVSISQSRKGGGKIEIEYYSLDDFNRIYDLLMSR